MNADLYSKPIEQLMVEGKISIYYQLDFNEDTKKTQYSWGAYALRKLDTNGKGDTPRDAIIDLYKQLH